MAKSKKRTQDLTKEDENLVQIKSKLDAEFRRFSIPKPGAKKSPKSAAENELEEPVWSFAAFRILVQKLHGLEEHSFSIEYADPNDGDLLPINNDQNFHRALVAAKTTLRLVVTRCDVMESPTAKFAPDFLPRVSKKFFFFGSESNGSYSPPTASKQTVRSIIGRPKNFRHVSAILDADRLPTTQRRVKLCKNGPNGQPLGLYIRDGRRNARGKTSHNDGPGIFISRLLPGGLAASTGLLSVGDEILEINGILVGRGAKTLDQVANMMMANAEDLTITIKITSEQTDDETRPNISAPTTPNSSKRRANRIKRTELSSSVFYVDDDDEPEDQVIDLLSTPQKF